MDGKLYKMIFSTFCVELDKRGVDTADDKLRSVLSASLAATLDEMFPEPLVQLLDSMDGGINVVALESDMLDAVAEADEGDDEPLRVLLEKLGFDEDEETGGE